MIMPIRSTLVITAMALAVHSLAAATEVPGGQNTVVELRFAARVGKEPATCAKTYRDVGTSHASMFLQDFRIYVSAIRLIAKDGTEVPLTLTADDRWQNESVALLDFENGSGNCNGNGPINDRIKGSVPLGDYRGVAFDIGVPFEMNHQDPTLAGAPLNYSALTWPWSVGYKFTTIDFDTKPPGERTMMSMMEGAHEQTSATGFSVHLGSMECASSGPRVPPKATCGSPNRPTYRFDPFDAQKDVLILDLRALLEDTDVTRNMPKSASGCMAFAKDDDCVAIMDRFGLTFRGKPSSGQKFIRVERAL